MLDGGEIGDIGGSCGGGVVVNSIVDGGVVVDDAVMICVGDGVGRIAGAAHCVGVVASGVSGGEGVVVGRVDSAAHRYVKSGEFRMCGIKQCFRRICCDELF